MKATLAYGVEDIRVENVSDPQITDPGDVIVKVTAGAICGSDLHIYRGHFELPEGSGVGHEFVGRVEEIGKDVKNFKKGDKVIGPFWVSCGHCHFCNENLTTSCLNGGCFGFGGLLGNHPGCQADYIKVSHADGTLVKAPESLADDSQDEKTLFLGDNISTGYHGAVMGEINPGDTVVVLGDGAVGLFAAYSASLFNPGNLIVVGHHDYRLKVGLFWEPFPLNVTDFFLRNLRLKGGVAPSRVYIPELLPKVESGDLDPTHVISHTLSLDEVPRGYEMMNSRKDGAIKIVFKP